MQQPLQRLGDQVVHPVERIHKPMDVVAGQQLIPAKAAQGDFDLRLHKPRHIEPLKQIDLGLLSMPDHLGEFLQRV